MDKKLQNRPRRRPPGSSSSQPTLQNRPPWRPPGSSSSQPTRTPVSDRRPAIGPRPRPSEPPIRPTEGQKRARGIPSEERAKRGDFVAARAHLSAGFTGAPVGNPETLVAGAAASHPEERNLQTEVDSATKKVNSWGPRNKSPKVNDEDSQSIYDHTLQNDYSELKRFQNEPEHNKPKKEYYQKQTGLEQHREFQIPLDSVPESEEKAKEVKKQQDILQEYKAEEGAAHAAGLHYKSPFVSLTNNPQALRESVDDSAGGAREIANNAKEMHTYHVPKQYSWDMDKIANKLSDEHVGHKGNTKEWLQKTPKPEGEELYLGGDLDKYRTKREVNPYLPK